jgi:hypothetical protein
LTYLEYKSYLPKFLNSLNDQNINFLIHLTLARGITSEETVVFKTTDILSHNNDDGPSHAIPNDRSMYIISRMGSVSTLEVSNSDAQFNVSTVF